MTAFTRHRLDGLEPDNLLAFLALLGLLRTLEARDRQQAEGDKLRPRAAWDIDNPPVRPVLHLALNATREQIADAAAEGLASLAEGHDFDGQRDLAFRREEANSLLIRAAESASTFDRAHVDLLAALMSDASVKQAKNENVIEPTPLCLLYGQGHQHFLDRLAKVPAQEAPPPRGRGKKSVSLTAEECLAEALFVPWHRSDPTFSFRWDPEEDVRYALMAGDPTANAYKTGTQHGANRLAAIGLAALTVAPGVRAGRVRLAVVGGSYETDGFSLAWPIWREPATLSAIRALLAHPKLREPNGLARFGVDQVMITRRISVGKYMNFTRARPLAATRNESARA